jgi:hypothetical protein
VQDFLPTFLVYFWAISFPKEKYFVANLSITTTTCLGLIPLLYLLYKKFTYQKQNIGFLSTVWNILIVF